VTLSATDAPRPVASIVVCTYNRVDRLPTALAAFDRLQDPGIAYEIVVVDNASTDGTADLLRAWAAGGVPGGPARRALREPRSGKSFALNLAVESTASDWLALTDDDVVVAPDWLVAARQALDARPDIDYVGGKVLPLWEAPPPAWFSMAERDLFGTIAILDYGDEPFDYDRRVPLGANIVYRRRAFQRAGLFRTDLGRDHTTLRGQEFPEHLLRVEAAGGRGRYVPGLVVSHHVPAWRLTKKYYREWFYWKGISRALMAETVPIDDVGTDYRVVPRIAGIPRFMFRQAAGTAARLAGRAVRGDAAGAFVREAWLWYYWGFARQSWRTRRAASNGGPRSSDVQVPH
jgi:glycosyltransferase involved in cell wall biosynthesis